jgi:hypothetical protein
VSKTNSCGSCGSNHLFAKWDSDTGVGWVHCDKCGRISTAVPLSAGRAAIIAKWNDENPTTEGRRPMVLVFQTINGADDGNCLSACIASILALPIEQVPNFAKDHGDRCEEACREWLRSRGMRLAKIGFKEYATFANTYFDNDGEFCIVSGPSTFPNRAHAVVGRVNSDGGIDVVHDPCGGSGLPEGYRWVSFIVSAEVRP